MFKWENRDNRNSRNDRRNRNDRSNRRDRSSRGDRKRRPWDEEGSDCQSNHSWMWGVPSIVQFMNQCKETGQVNVQDLRTAVDLAIAFLKDNEATKVAVVKQLRQNILFGEAASAEFSNEDTLMDFAEDFYASVNSKRIFDTVYGIIGNEDETVLTVNILRSLTLTHFEEFVNLTNSAVDKIAEDNERDRKVRRSQISA